MGVEWVFVFKCVGGGRSGRGSLFRQHLCNRIFPGGDSGHFVLSVWLIQSPLKKGHLTVQLSLDMKKQT